MRFSIKGIVLTVLLVFSISTGSVQAKSSLERAGDIVQVLIPATAYATTFRLGDNEGRKQFYKSFFTNFGVTFALKYSINKPRPEGNGDHSFPSGHTSAAFQGAAFIHRRYGWKYGMPAYIGAAFVGWSRAEGESDKHDFTDVAAGALIGALSSYYLTTKYKNLTFKPVVDSENVGMSLSCEW